MSEEEKHVLTSIIIPTHNGFKHLRNCVESIREHTEAGTYEIIVVDNGSTDETPMWCQTQQDLVYIRNEENEGFPRACNQGLRRAGGDSILFLNNDTIVTTRWLSNLRTALYSHDDIGAVGPITNAASYGTAIPVAYKNTNEMQSFAANFNHSNPSAWEERLKLVGFCLLVKQEVAEKVGEFDERFSPGNFEDDDYCYRIRQVGYRLLLCHDTFIHHVGNATFSENPEQYRHLMRENTEKFHHKWGFNPIDSSNIRLELIQQMEPGIPRMRILDIGCGCGATLLFIRHHFPDAQVCGIEGNPASARIASTVAEVKNVDVESPDWTYPTCHFDVILLGDVLEHVKRPERLLARLRPLLKPGGRLIASIANAAHISVIQHLLQGYRINADIGYDQTPLRGFTLAEINRLFTQAGYEDIRVMGLKQPLSRIESEWISRFEQWLEKEAVKQTRIVKFLLTAESRRDEWLAWKRWLWRAEFNIERQKEEERLSQSLAYATPEFAAQMIDRFSVDRKRASRVLISFLRQSGRDDWIQGWKGES